MSFIIQGNHRGKVLATDSAEDNKYGRIKVEVFPYLVSTQTASQLGADETGMKIEDIPWAVPAYPLTCGSGEGYGFFSVPEIGSSVWVFFEAGNVYQPVYFAEAPTGIHGLPNKRLTNYPDTLVIQTVKGDSIVIDKVSGGIKLESHSGSFIDLNSDGTIYIESNGDVKIN